MLAATSLSERLAERDFSECSAEELALLRRLVEEAGECCADARASGPVGSGLRDPRVGVVGSARGELAREAGESRGKDEGL